MDEKRRQQLEYALRLRTEIRDRQFADDPYLWMTEIVKTKDEASQAVRPFPKDKPYIKDALDCLRSGYNKIAFPKSRRMFASWIVSLWVTHTARYWPNHAIYWQSEQEQKAAFVVDERCKFVEDNLPQLYRREYEAYKAKSGQVGKLIYKGTGSYILGIAQGDSQIRSYTPSILVMDECEFMPEAHKALKAALSTVEKEAKIVLLSTSDGPSGILAGICRNDFVRFK